MPSASQKRIAKLAGVSQATVSLALKGHPRISEAKREEIRRIAHEIGYVPNPVLSRLAERRFRDEAEDHQETIGYLVDRDVDGVWDNRGFDRCCELAPAFGYSVERFELSRYPRPERLQQVLRARGIQGLVVGRLYQRGFVERFEWKHFCAIACGSGHYDPPVHMILADEAGARLRCWEEARKRGYRRPILIDFRAPPSPRLDSLKMGAVRTIQYEAGIDDRLFHRIDRGPDDRRILARKIHEGKPDVAICATAEGLWLLRSLDLPLPTACCYVAPGGQWVSGTRTSRRVMMRAALERLDSLLRNYRYGPSTELTLTLVPFVWIEGRSLPPKESGADSPVCTE